MLIEPLKIKIESSKLKFEEDNGEFCTISFHRTLRLPMDGKIYPLPPSFGQFPISKVEDYADKVPDSWKAHGGVFIPMFQREAMWIEFGNKDGNAYPFALKVAVGKVNAITGDPYDQKIKPGKQDYVVIPTQPWLDGINAGDGVIKQFVAMPLGGGYTVEAQVTGEEKFGGIQLVAFPPKNKAVPAPKNQQKDFLTGLFGTSASKPAKSNDFFSVAQSAIPAPQMYSKNLDAAPAPPMYSGFADALAPPTSSGFSFAPQQQQQSYQPPMLGGFAKDVEMNNMFDGFAEAEESFKPAASYSYSGGRGGARGGRGGAPMAMAKRAAVPQPTITKQDKAAEMGLSAGGKMKQKIITDPHGAFYWDEVNFGRVYVHIVNSELYYQITGKYPPPTPIDASAYTNFGYPWYDYYAENSQNSVPESSVLSKVKDVKQVDQSKYAWPQQDDSTVPIPGYQVKKIGKKDPNEVSDGDW